MPRYAAHAPGLASRLINGEEVVVSSRTGKVWALNASGAFLWELADGSCAIDELVTQLAAARGIDEVQAREEIEAFGDDLSARGLLAWREVPGAASRRAKRAAEHPPRNLPEPPRVVVEEPLQVLAAVCISGHDGQVNCMKYDEGCGFGWE